MMEGRDFARDRISGLPDPLLTHILSFLPTEEAVRTCILSKRWIKVWASLPVLVFDNHKCRQYYPTKGEFLKLQDEFLRFLHGFTFHREKLTLDTIKLKCLGHVGNTLLLHIYECLCSVVDCKPRILSINTDNCTFSNLPDSIFTCTSVEKMSLRLNTTYRDHGDYSIKPRSINLPFLKKLELGYLDMIHMKDIIMRMLISGCPVLEELVFTNCWLELNEISSNVLKKLVINECHCFGPTEISCPGVVSLSINSTRMRRLTLKNMSSLATADILNLDSNSNYYTHNHNLGILNGFSIVTSLKLHTTCPKLKDWLKEDIPNCPTFKNLKNLELGALNINIDWNLVACLLQHSSNLKDLTLHFWRLSDDVAKEELQGDLSFQHKYLEAVKISCPGKNVKLVGQRILTPIALAEITTSMVNPSLVCVSPTFVFMI